MSQENLRILRPFAPRPFALHQIEINTSVNFCFETSRMVVQDFFCQQILYVNVFLLRPDSEAGITTTLNARTAVLAAANPAYGRYNVSATPQENINLPAALLSRFDLMWLILDTASAEADIALAHHVLHVHREGKPPAGVRLKAVEGLL